MRGELVDAEPADQHRQRLRPQPRPVALRAGPERHVLLDLLSRPLRVGLPVAALEVGHDPLEVRHVRAPAPVAVAVRHVHALAVGAVQEALANAPRAGPPRACPCRPPTCPRSPASSARSSSTRSWTTAGSRPRRATGRVGHDQLRIDLHLRPEAGAARAGAVRRVEGEHPRLQLRHRRAAVEAHEAVRVGGDLAACRRSPRPRCPRPRHRGLDRVREALAQVRPHHQPVDHHGDVVLALLVEVDGPPRGGGARRPPSRG